MQIKLAIIGCSIVVFALSAFNKAEQPAIKASIDRGKKVYEMTCLACHQADGQGVQRMNPTLVKTKWITGDKKALIKIVLNGLPGGQIEIDGDDFHNPMPPQAALLSDQQVADVLTYVRNSFGNKSAAITVPEVKAVRGAAAIPVKKSRKQ